MTEPAGGGVRRSAALAAAPSFRSLTPGVPATAIALDSNENPLGPSPAALRAIAEHAPLLHRYPPLDDASLRAALADFHGHSLRPEGFVTGNGAGDLLAMIAFACLQPGDEILCCPPTFPVFPEAARRRGAAVREVSLTEDHFAVDAEALIAAAGPRTAAVYLCNPNNPTGTTFPAETLDRLLAGLPEHTLLVYDECYRPFATEVELPATLTRLHDSPNLLVLYSFSKAWGLAGLRCGYAVADEALADYLARARQPYHLGTLTLHAAQAALTDLEHLRASVELVATQRRRLYRELEGLVPRVWPSQANFLCFEASDAALADRLRDRGVRVRRLKSFGAPGLLRVSVGLPQENDRFLEALRDAQAPTSRRHSSSAAPPP